MKGKRWVVCPKCGRRIFRWGPTGIEIASGARVMQPMDRTGEGWVTRVDEVAIAQCPRGHMADHPNNP